jgi:beta-lactam-binding protein with PASTA domain
MARPVPTDLEDALAADPAARDHFWALPPEQKDRWVSYVERARFPGARRRRVAETVRRLRGAPAAVAEDRPAEAPPAAAVPLPRDDWSIWLAGLGLLAALAAFLVWLTVFHNKGDDARPAAVVVSAKSTVPKVTGIRYQAAQFQLHEAKLTSTVAQRSSTKPKGIVLKQTPVDGKTVPQGTQVALVVSKGPSGVAMPDLTGMAAADALKALQKRKLVAAIEQTPSKEAPGTVVGQDPKAGTRAKPGTKVTLQVAKGRTSVDVPSVTGQSQTDAVATLKNVGLAATVAEVPSTQPAGTVVAQSPAGGTKVVGGSKVRLNVAKAKASTQPSPTTQGSTTQRTTTQATTTTAPTTTTTQPSNGNDYTGMKLKDAVQQIADGRQQSTVLYQASAKPVGTVLSNSSSGGKVHLVVSAGPKAKAPTDVPSTTGEDAQTAQQDLQAAGFTVIQVTWPVSDAANDGVVVAQTPTGSGGAPQGAAIVVYVGSASGG